MFIKSEYAYFLKQFEHLDVLYTKFGQDPNPKCRKCAGNTMGLARVRAIMSRKHFLLKFYCSKF